MGYGYLNGKEHGFLLNPIDDKPEPKSVPEPAPTLGLLGLGILGVSTLGQRIKKNDN